MVRLCLTCARELTKYQQRFCSRACWGAYRHAMVPPTKFTDGSYNVYALSLADGFYRYVGCTAYVKIETRVAQWFAQRFQLQTPVYRWLQKNVTNRSQLRGTLLEVVTPGDEDRIRENFWIEELLALGFPLVNQQTGGLRNFTQPSWNKGKHTGPRAAETRTKISIALMGNTNRRVKS